MKENLLNPHKYLAKQLLHELLVDGAVDTERCRNLRLLVQTIRDLLSAYAEDDGAASKSAPQRLEVVFVSEDE